VSGLVQENGDKKEKEELHHGIVRCSLLQPLVVELVCNGPLWFQGREFQVRLVRRRLHSKKKGFSDIHTMTSDSSWAFRPK